MMVMVMGTGVMLAQLGMLAVVARLCWLRSVRHAPGSAGQCSRHHTLTTTDHLQNPRHNPPVLTRKLLHSAHPALHPTMRVCAPPDARPRAVALARRSQPLHAGSDPADDEAAVAVLRERAARLKEEAAALAQDLQQPPPSQPASPPQQPPPTSASTTPTTPTPTAASTSESSAAADLLARAARLREEARAMDAQLQPERDAVAAAAAAEAQAVAATRPPPPKGPSLRGRRVLVVGANGSVGSRVARLLLRTTDVDMVVGTVRSVERSSSYSRIAYESGAEDGRGTVPGLSGLLTNEPAYMEYTDAMRSYRLNRLKLLPVDLLDAESIQSVINECQCDAIVWCAATTNVLTSINPFIRRVPSLGETGTVEREGVQSAVRCMQKHLLNKRPPLDSNAQPGDPPARFVLLSSDMELERGERDGERVALQAFPSTSVVVRSIEYDNSWTDGDNEEALQIRVVDARDGSPLLLGAQKRKEPQAPSANAAPAEVGSGGDGSGGEGERGEGGGGGDGAGGMGEVQETDTISREVVAGLLVSALTDDGLWGRTVRVSSVVLPPTDGDP